MEVVAKQGSRFGIGVQLQTTRTDDLATCHSRPQFVSHVADKYGRNSLAVV